MPSTRTPDPSADTSAGLPPVLPSPAAEAVPLVTAPADAFGGLRLVEVPGGWPPYDCEVHVAPCTSQS